MISERSFSCVGRSGSKTAIESTTIYSDENSSSSDLLGLNAGIGSSSSSGPKKVRVLSYYSTIFASIGKSIVLPCKAAGRPHPEIFWLDTEQTMIGTQNPRQKVLPNGDLLISPLRWSDMGTYTCIARNAISKDTAETFVYPSVSWEILIIFICSHGGGKTLAISHSRKPHAMQRNNVILRWNSGRFSHFWNCPINTNTKNINL